MQVKKNQAKKFNKNKKFYKKKISWKLKKKAKRYYWRTKLRLRLKKTNKPTYFFLIRAKKGSGTVYNKKKYNRQIHIRITSNNVFCTLLKLDQGVITKTLLVTSAGKAKVRMSKKLLKRYALDRILGIFYARARRIMNAGGLIVILVVPIKTRKRIVRNLNFNLRKYVTKKIVNGKKIETKGYRSLLIKILDKKIFNGCQAKKKKRKKKNFSRLKR